MDKLGFEEQVSISLDDHDTLVADSESDTSSSDQFRCFTKNGLIKVEEDRNEHDIIKKGFLVGMGQLGKETDVVAVHRNSYDGLTGQARFETFRIFSQAVAQKCGGSANIKYAWYGGSREEICEIISHGFSRCRRPEKIEVYGHGVNLSPAKFSIDGALSSGVDENGLRHMLLCRVILGKSEAICAGSDKFQPSSKEFDSGVDNLFSPRKYIIWSAYMNSHIFPNYVISFKAPSSVGLQRNITSAAKPSSPYMRFPCLMSKLANYLPPSKMELLAKYHNNFRANKMTRSQLIRRVRQVAGDELLMAVIKQVERKDADLGGSSSRSR